MADSSAPTSRIVDRQAADAGSLPFMEGKLEMKFGFKKYVNDTLEVMVVRWRQFTHVLQPGHEIVYYFEDSE